MPVQEKSSMNECIKKQRMEIGGNARVMSDGDWVGVDVRRLSRHDGIFGRVDNNLQFMFHSRWWCWGTTTIVGVLGHFVLFLFKPTLFVER